MKRCCKIILGIFFLYSFNVFAFNVLPPEIKKGDGNKIITTLKMQHGTGPKTLIEETGNAILGCVLNEVFNCAYERSTLDHPSPGYVRNGYSIVETSIEGNCCIYLHKEILYFDRNDESKSLSVPTNKKFKRCCDNGTVTGGDLSVKLKNFKVKLVDDELVLYWETASERNNSGMNLWCTQMQGSQFQEITQLNSELIPSKAILPNYGASYSSIDYPYINTDLKPGVQHCALEDIDASGQCTLHCDQIDTVVIGEGNKLSNTELDELQAKAIALCNEHKQDGVCLDQLLAPNQ